MFLFSLTSVSEFNSIKNTSKTLRVVCRNKTEYTSIIRNYTDISVLIRNLPGYKKSRIIKNEIQTTFP